jgi:hypothetical protein
MLELFAEEPSALFVFCAGIEMGVTASAEMSENKVMDLPSETPAVCMAPHAAVVRSHCCAIVATTTDAGLIFRGFPELFIRSPRACWHHSFSRPRSQVLP